MRVIVVSLGMFSQECLACSYELDVMCHTLIGYNTEEQTVNITGIRGEWVQ